jgi:hypothetical protein
LLINAAIDLVPPQQAREWPGQKCGFGLGPVQSTAACAGLSRIASGWCPWAKRVGREQGMTPISLCCWQQGPAASARGRMSLRFS